MARVKTYNKRQMENMAGAKEKARLKKHNSAQKKKKKSSSQKSKPTLKQRAQAYYKRHKTYEEKMHAQTALASKGCKVKLFPYKGKMHANRYSPSKRRQRPFVKALGRVECKGPRLKQLQISLQKLKKKEMQVQKQKKKVQVQKKKVQKQKKKVQKKQKQVQKKEKQVQKKKKQVQKQIQKVVQKATKTKPKAATKRLATPSDLNPLANTLRQHVKNDTASEKEFERLIRDTMRKYSHKDDPEFVLDTANVILDARTTNKNEILFHLRNLFVATDAMHEKYDGTQEEAERYEYADDSDDEDDE